MKIQYYLTVIFIIINLSSFSQVYPFPDTSASWSETQIVYGGPGDPWVYSVGRLEVDGDTSIFGIDYKKLLWFEYCDTFPQSTVGYYRVDSLKVFFRDNLSIAIPPFINLPYVNFMLSDTGEVLLYDFALQVGDTFQFQTGVIDSVASIDSILLNGTYRKKINFLNMYTNGNLGPYYWIEGVGSTYGFFPAYFILENELFFNCFSTYNDTISFGGSCPCSPLGINENNLVDKEIRIIPNPCKSSTNILFPVDKLHTLYIFDLLGNKVKNITFQGKEFHLDISELNKGVYILKTENDNFEKIIIQ